MANKPKTSPVSKTVNIADLINQAELNDGIAPYANFVHVSASGYELILDFYQINPDRGKSIPVIVKHVERIFVPLSLGKGLATAIANVIANFEADNNIVIPLGRDPDPSDKIAIWS